MPRTLTSARRKQIAELFPQVPAKGDADGKPLRDRIYASILEPMVSVDGIRLKYLKRTLFAWETEDSVAMAAALYGLQRDMFEACFPGHGMPRALGSNHFSGSPMLRRALSVLTTGGVQKYINDSSGTFTDMAANDVEIFLAEKLVEVDAVLTAREDAKTTAEAAIEAAVDDVAPSPAP